MGTRGVQQGLQDQVSLPGAQQWPRHGALVPINPRMMGLSSQSAMVPCFGSFPKQHPGAHTPPALPQAQAEFRS